MSAPSIRYRKMNGLGNEILVVDLRPDSAAADTVALTPGMVRRIAAEPRTRFDQMMVLQPPRTPATDAFVQIYNADGSVSAACGNGTRCVAAVVMDETGRREAAFETGAGPLPAWDAGDGLITVDMGVPKFGWAEIPLARAVADTRAIDLRAGPGGSAALSAPSVVNIGNPHAIFWVDDVDAHDLARLGPMLETDPLFPERANISLARVTSPESITLRVWERGAGLTRACGSAACAAAVAAARNGLTGRSVAVTLPGGVLQIAWRESDDHVLMTGPWEFEYAGEISVEAVAAAALHEPAA